MPPAAGDGVVIGVDRFGASAPWREIDRHLGITADRATGLTRELLSSLQGVPHG